MTERIIVSGTYKSGTSLTTELIHLWGAYAGREDDIYQGQHGCMEHLALQKLNDELLNDNSYVPMLADELEAKAEDSSLKERALQILDEMDKEARQNGSVAWVWKDPRLPLVIPFWEKIWKDVIYIIPVRHPMETLQSGARMEGLSMEDTPFSVGFAYWQFCMLNVLQYTEHTSRKLFLAYDQLIQNPQQECERLCHFLDQECGVLQKSASEIETLVSKITAEKYHSRASTSLAEMDITSREQRALYNFLRVKVMYPNESFNPQDFALHPGWRESLQIMERLLSLKYAGLVS